MVISTMQAGKTTILVAYAMDIPIFSVIYNSINMSNVADAYVLAVFLYNSPALIVFINMYPQQAI